MKYLQVLIGKILIKTKNYITFLLRAVAIKIRIFFLGEVKNELHKIQSDTSSTLVQVQRIASFSAGEAYSRQRPVGKEFVNAADIESIFRVVSKNLAQWSQCDIIYTCPLTHAGISTLLKHENIVIIYSAEHFITKIQSTEKIRNIGVASPWLMDTLLDDRIAPLLLIRSCKRRVLFLEGARVGFDNIGRRTRLHHLGFYEISEVVDATSHDLVSIGVSANGEFFFFGSTPAICQPSNEWLTISACRLAEIATQKLEWENLCFPPFVSTETGFVPFSDGFSLAIVQPNEGANNYESYIKATFTWCTSRVGHASLVGCYSGPSDSHMYACLLQSPSDNSLLVTLYINDGAWRTLGEAISVPLSYYEVGAEQNSATVELSITKGHINIGVGGKNIMNIENAELMRNSRVGIRSSGCLFSISQIVTNKG